MLPLLPFLARGSGAGIAAGAAVWRCQKTQPVYNTLNSSGTHMMRTSLATTSMVTGVRVTIASLTLRNRLWHTVSVKLESVLPLGFRPAGDFQSAVVDLSLKQRR